uniref:Membrane-bound transcription factor site-2 protease n=1 Tax=Pundamilia nyererei TaxID=303518 RepID=A0A3B4EUN5_9CICH
MIPVSLLVFVMAGWCAVYLADTLLRSSVTHRISYESWLASRGLMLSPFHVRWQTTMFNRLFAYCARINPRALYMWFNSGLVFGIAAMLGSVVLLIRTLQQTIAQMTTDNPRIGDQQTLQVVVPGVNLPTSQLAYFFIALLLSGVIHELGHAVAALREQVRVNGFGMFVFVVYPGAFVDLFTTHLNLISPAQQLRIFCAENGGRYNLCLKMYSFMFILKSLDRILSFIVKGLYLCLRVYLVQSSAADGPRGLSVGDIVTGLEDCPVRGVEDWTSCLSHLAHTPQTGYCVPVASLQPSWAHGRAFKRLDGTMDCCSNNSLTDLCFSYIKSQGRSSREREYACMPVRKMVTGTRVCHTDDDCAAHSHTASICVTPSLENQTRFIRVTHPPNTHMLFVGYPPHLQYAVSLTNFVPRFGFLHLDLPVFLETFCKYVVSLSGALAVVNSVPCFALDGQWMLNALLEATLASVVIDRQKRELIGFFLLLAGSALLAANVALGLWMVTAR